MATNFALYAATGQRLDYWDPNVFLASLAIGIAALVVVSLLTQPEPEDRIHDLFERLQTSSDRAERRFFYDGKTFTLFAPRTSYYASVNAPPTIGQLADTLETHFGIELPLVDLFRWGTKDGIDGQLTSANYVGPANIEGVTCEQYAFRQNGVDWQVWVQSGEFKLPRKVVITTTTDEARPQYSAVYTWNLAPSFDDAAFAFVPTKDAHKIILADATKANTAGKR